jgi:hypothetical protein
MTYVSIILPLLFWFGLPAYVAGRMGRPYGYRRAWAWGLFASWIGVYIVKRQLQPIRAQVISENARRQREASRGTGAAEEAGEDLETLKLRKFGLKIKDD